MTLTEKLGQLTMTACGSAVTGPTIAGDSTEAIRSGAIGNLLNLVGLDNVRAMQRIAVEESRLKIPLLIGLDVIHGHRTLFPIPLAEAGAFDARLWEASAREAAAEASADGLHLTFAPMLDVARDPRWGRSAEGPGEDAWLGARIAEAKVRGFQGTDLRSAAGVAACAKHYCAYAAVTAGREYASVDVSERALREVYLPPFEAAVAAGVATVMPAFTDLAGVPMTAHRALLNGYLRGRLGFAGVIVSDYNAIAELIHHGVAADIVEAAALALAAGVDIDMMANAYRFGLPVALERGLADVQQVDAAVRRVLALKARLGLFENPYRHAPAADAAAVTRRRQVARQIAERSVVLLKNDGVLPLAETPSRLALIGPLAWAGAEMRGPWWGAADPAGHVSVFEGLRTLWPQAALKYAPGVGIESEDDSGIAAAAALAESVPVSILCVGEAANMSGEAASRAHLGLPGLQRHLCETVIERAHARGGKVVVVLFSGRPLALPWLLQSADAVFAAWFPGSEAGHAIARLIGGRASPSGRTPVSWPRSVGQVPVFFGQRPSGRPAAADDHYTSKYLDEQNSPLVPFGFGLTYGRVEYRDLAVSPAQVTAAGSIEVRVEVGNVGARAVRETVFVFVRDPVAIVTRPLLELRGVTQVELAPGQSAQVRVTIAASSLRFPGPDLEPLFEAGDLEVLVGPCAERAQLLSATDPPGLARRGAGPMEECLALRAGHHRRPVDLLRIIGLALLRPGQAVAGVVDDEQRLEPVIATIVLHLLHVAEEGEVVRALGFRVFLPQPDGDQFSCPFELVQCRIHGP